jgi:hypothetical protein
MYAPLSMLCFVGQLMFPPVLSVLVPEIARFGKDPRLAKRFVCAVQGEVCEGECDEDKDEGWITHLCYF